MASETFGGYGSYDGQVRLLEREPLLDRMEEHLSAARRHGCLLLLAGEAGVGKTSLVQAFCRDRAEAETLWGTCDGIVPARPFAPLADIAARSGGPLQAALAEGDRNRVFEVFLTVLRRSRAGTVVVFEDLHWADDATLDLLHVVGRRLRDLPLLLIGTFREEEVGNEHPLRLVLGDLPARATSRLRVPPLSVVAVEALAAGSDVDPRALHRSTAGNAFFVTEVLAGAGSDVLPTVRDAVLARVGRLSEDAQAVVRAASVVGPRCERDVLLEVAGSDPAALDECMDRGVLELDGPDVHFRHELAQGAVAEGLSNELRPRLHARALAVLRRNDLDDATNLARHAAGAGDADAVLEFAPPAADRAAELGAHVAASQHYAAALRFAFRLDARSRARLLERHANECLLVDDANAAVASQRRALAEWRDLEDIRGEGGCLSRLSLMLWHVGDAAGAVEAAETAVGLLGPASPPSAELAGAYAALARLQSLTERSATLARANAELGVSLAERVGDEAVAVSALTTIAVLDIYAARETGWPSLERALGRARSAGLDEELGRALVNLVEAGADLRRYDIADRYRDEALAQVNERGVDRIFLQRRLLSDLAELDLERGRWEDAERLALELVGKERLGAVARARALAVVGRLRARRGEAGAWELLDDALALGVSERGLLPAARAEIAWLVGDLSLSRREAEGGLAAAADWEDEDRWWRGELVFWLWKAGGGSDLVQKAAEPYALHIGGRYREAAAMWRSIGAPYKEALALAECADEQSLRQALEIFNNLGARPMARHVAGSLQRSGARRIPRGPRAATVRNPAGLTPREFEVLTLLDSGIRNVDIAERLVLSPKTVEHHVSAILRKLGVANRDAAAAEATRLGLQDGGRPTPR
jgi:DNA-binding CsgD family transcriptional regulator